MNTEVTADTRAMLHRALGDVARVLIADALAVSDRTPGELREVTGATWNLLAHHLGVLEDAGLVERHRSEGDGRRRYVRLRPGALDHFAHVSTLVVRRPLFVCTHNSARSQFAAALWRKTTGSDADSAGSHPADRVHPLAVKVARAHGVDLRASRPRGYNQVANEPGVVVSVCDRALEARPPFHATTLHWSVPDPSDRDESAFRWAFADIAERVQRLARAAA